MKRNCHTLSFFIQESFSITESSFVIQEFPYNLHTVSFYPGIYSHTYRRSISVGTLHDTPSFYPGISFKCIQRLHRIFLSRNFHTHTHTQSFYPGISLHQYNTNKLSLLSVISLFFCKKIFVRVSHSSLRFSYYIGVVSSSSSCCCC